MAVSQAQEIERAAQLLAKLVQEDYSAGNMLAHYLKTAPVVNPRIVEIVTVAAEIVQPLLTRLDDAGIEQTLLSHDLRSCRAEYRNLADYLSSMQARLPVAGGAFQRDDVLDWLRVEIEQAPGRAARRAGP